MLRAVLRRLSFANLMATLAVILALTGGVAWAAFTGNGQIRSGAQKGFTAAFSTVLSVPGIGNIQANCTSSVGGDQVKVRFKNTSGASLKLYAATTNVTLANGAVSQAFNASQLWFDLMKPNAADQPLAVIHVFGGNVAGSSCANELVGAQAVVVEP